MKNKKLILSTLLVLSIMLSIIVVSSEASAATGDLKNIYPPGNNGTSKGVGMITGDDGNNYVFKTPKDNNSQELTLGPIDFSVVNGRRIASVSQDVSAPIGEALDAISRDAKLTKVDAGNALNAREASTDVANNNKVAKFKAGKALADTVKGIAQEGGNPQTSKEIKIAAK